MVKMEKMVLLIFLWIFKNLYYSGIISSYNSMNKIISKEIFIKNNILTPNYFTLEKKSLI